jgi:hypothetical protein
VDGWLYGANGSTTTNVGVPGGPRTRWTWAVPRRFHPQKKTFQIYAEGGGTPAASSHIDGKGRVFSGTNYGDTRGMHYELGLSYGVKNWGKHGPLTNPHAYGWSSTWRTPATNGASCMPS